MPTKGNLRRKYIAIRRNPNAPAEFDVYGKKLKLGTSGAMVINDRQLARDLDQKYGRFSRNVKGGGQSLLVMEVGHRDEQTRDGYRVHFSVPELPWKVKKHGRKGKRQ